MEQIGARTEQIAVETALCAYVTPVTVDAVDTNLILYALYVLWHHHPIFDEEGVRLLVGECDAVGIVDLRRQRRLDN